MPLRLAVGFFLTRYGSVLSKASAYILMTTLGIPRYGAGSFIYNNKLYVVGGVGTRGVTNVIERVDLSTLKRDYPQYLPSPRAFFAFGFINGKFYVAGGVDEGGVPRKEIFEYDPSTNSVSTKTNLPKGVAYCGSAVAGGKLYVIGGIDDAGNILKDTYVYDPSANSVSTRASMNYARENLACNELGGKIYCFGGDDGSSLMSVVEVYDPSSNAWSVLNINLPLPLSGLNSTKVLINGVEKILLVGG